MGRKKVTWNGVDLQSQLLRSLTLENYLSSRIWKQPGQQRFLFCLYQMVSLCSSGWPNSWSCPSLLSAGTRGMCHQSWQRALSQNLVGRDCIWNNVDYELVTSGSVEGDCPSEDLFKRKENRKKQLRHFTTVEEGCHGTGPVPTIRLAGIAGCRQGCGDRVPEGPLCSMGTSDLRWGWTLQVHASSPLIPQKLRSTQMAHICTSSSFQHFNSKTLDAI